MNREISTYYLEGNSGASATINLDLKTDEFFIQYKDSTGAVCFEEKFPGKSINYVEDAAENWALGIKEIGLTF